MFRRKYQIARRRVDFFLFLRYNIIRMLQKCYNGYRNVTASEYERNVWWIMYIRLIMACAAMLLSLLCFDGVGADDVNYIAAEEKATAVYTETETAWDACGEDSQEAVIEAAAEGVLFMPMAARYTEPVSVPLMSSVGDDSDSTGDASDDRAAVSAAKDYEICILEDGGILYPDRFAKDPGAMAEYLAECERQEVLRRAEAQARRRKAEWAAEQRRIAEEKRRAEEKEAALRAACPGYDDAFVATLTEEEQAEARWFYEQGYVFYRQNWSSVKDAEYGDCGFGQCGCGPTCVAAIISNLAGVPVDPEEMRVYGLSVGSWLPSGGTTYGFLIETAKKYGITATQIYAGDKNALFEALRDENKLVLATMGPGDFTLGAHFMLFRGITDEGKILIADSYSFENSVKEWDYDVLYSQLKTGYWIFEKTN